MNLDGQGAAPMPEPVLPVVRLLQTFWGVGLIVGLFAYTLYGVLAPSPAVGVSTELRLASDVQASTQARQPYVPRPDELILTIHFACGDEDSRFVRSYDPPPSGRAVIFRLDQSAEQMKAIYLRTDPRFPLDTRIVTTPCMQDMIDLQAFP